MSAKASKPVPICKKCRKAHFGFQKCPGNETNDSKFVKTELTEEEKAEITQRLDALQEKFETAAPEDIVTINFLGPQPHGDAPLTPEELKEVQTREAIDNDPMDNEVLAEELVPKSDAEWKQAEADEYFMALAREEKLNAYQLGVLRNYGMIGPDGLWCPEHKDNIGTTTDKPCKYCAALIG